MRLLARVAPVVAVCAMIAAMLWPSLHSRFDIIDDHEILGFLGNDHVLSLGEAAHGAAQQFHESGSGRFRPLYYSLRLLETSLWGDDAAKWHAVRLVLACTTAIAIYSLGRLWLDPFMSALVTIASFFGPHIEVWTRLGPNETYALPLALWGSYLVARGHCLGKPRPAALTPAFVLLGLSGMAKENFVVFLPLAVIGSVVIGAWRNRGRDPNPGSRVSDVLVVAGCLGFSAWNTWMIGQSVAQHGHIYGVEPTFAGLFTNCKRYLSGRNLLLWLAPTAVAMVCLVGHRTDGQRGIRPGLQFLGMLVVGFVLLVVPQSVFYVGQSMFCRYFTPGNFFLVFAVGLSAAAIGAAGRSWRTGYRRVWLWGAMFAPMFLIGQDLLRHHRAAVEFANRTLRYDSQIERVLALHREDNRRPVVLVDAGTSEYEAAMSVARFLGYRSRGAVRPFLQVRGDGAANRRLTPFEESLVSDMRAWSTAGMHGFAGLLEFPASERDSIVVVIEHTELRHVHLARSDSLGTTVHGLGQQDRPTVW